MVKLVIWNVKILYQFCNYFLIFVDQSSILCQELINLCVWHILKWKEVNNFFRTLNKYSTILTFRFSFSISKLSWKMYKKILNCIPCFKDIMNHLPLWKLIHHFSSPTYYFLFENQSKKWKIEINHIFQCAMNINELSTYKFLGK